MWILTSDEESTMLQFSIWGYMDYLAHVVKMDDPSQIESIIKSIVHECISEYLPELKLDVERS